MEVTDLKQGIKNPDRVNVFIDGAFSFSLDVSQVVDYKIKVGKKITFEELEELKRASDFGKAYQRTLEWVLVRPRSTKELRDYLKRGKYKKEMEERKKEWLEKDSPCKKSRKESRNNGSEDADYSDIIVERILKRGYVDDKKFAEWYAENRFVKKGISKKRLGMELMEKGVSREIIDSVVEARNDEEEIKKIIAKKRARYDDDKLISYLCRQGFSYELAKKMVGEE